MSQFPKSRLRPTEEKAITIPNMESKKGARVKGRRFNEERSKTGLVLRERDRKRAKINSKPAPMEAKIHMGRSRKPLKAMRTVAPKRMTNEEMRRKGSPKRVFSCSTSILPLSFFWKSKSMKERLAREANTVGKAILDR